MIIIGERINSSIKKIDAAIRSKDTAFIQQEVKQQLQAGAHVIDLNAGTLLRLEPESIIWLIRIALGHGDKLEEMNIAIDSSNPVAIRAGLEVLEEVGRAKNAFVNSVTSEKEKLDEILPLVKKFNSNLVGLCMGETGIPDDTQDRLQLGREIVQAASDFNINPEKIYLDPLVLPISTDTKKGQVALETIKLIKMNLPEVKTVIGLSNISYGLPMKNLMNRTFLAMAMAYGLDAAILNPMDAQLMSMVKAAETLLGNDDFCMKFITAFRNNELTQ